MNSQPSYKIQTMEEWQPHKKETTCAKRTTQKMEMDVFSFTVRMKGHSIRAKKEQEHKFLET
jgi:hypothetical protein